MADQPNVFDDNSAPNGAPASDPSQTQVPDANTVFANQLAAIKNEQGSPKYDSVEKALSGLANAQEYIPQLKGELSQKDEEINLLKQKLEQMGSIDEVVSRLTAERATGEAPENTNQGGELSTDEQLESKLASLLDKRTLESTAKANQETVSTALNEAYGEKAASVAQSKAAELGLTLEQLGELAKQSPAAVLKLFGKSGVSAPTPTTPSYNLSIDRPHDNPLEKPEKSLLMGATSKDQIEYMRKVRADVYKRHGITEN